MSRAERRVTFWLKALGLAAIAIWLLVGLLEFFGNVRATALLVVAAVFFAYLVYPLVRRFNERMPLIWAILIVYVFIIIVGVGITQLVVPPLVNDIQTAVRTLPAHILHWSVVLEDPNNRFFRWVPSAERAYLATIPAQIVAYLQNTALETAQKTLTVVLSTVSILTSLVIVPILAAYMLLDAENLKESFLGLVPAKGRAKADAIIGDLDSVVGGFIRGQIIDGTILATMITIMLAIMHVPYALLIGLASGVLNVIPYAGALIAFIPAVTLALAYNGPTNALIVAVLIVVIHQIDGNFVAPRVLKENVGLSPFWIVIAILGGSELFGLPGTFLAVPVAAMLRVLREHLLPAPLPRAAARPALTPEPLEQSRPARRRG